jgi:hypothetical protein
VKVGSSAAVEHVEGGMQAAHDLRAVGAVADDLGEGQVDETGDARLAAVETDGPGVVVVPTRRVGAIGHGGEQVDDPIDGLHPGRRVVDRRRQRAYGDVDELAQREAGVLDEGPFATEEETGDHRVAVDRMGSGRVDAGQRTGRADVLPHLDEHLDPRVVRGCELDERGVVDRLDDAGTPAVADRRRCPRDGGGQEHLVIVRSRGRQQCGTSVDGDLVQQVLDAQHAGHAVEEGDEDRQGRQEQQVDHADGDAGDERLAPAADLDEGVEGEHERRQEDAEGHVREARAHEDAHDARRVLPAGELDGDERGREDDTEEGEHRGSHRRREGRRRLGPGPQQPGGRAGGRDAPVDGHRHLRQDEGREHEEARHEPERGGHALAEVEAGDRLVGRPSGADQLAGGGVGQGMA